MPQLGVFPSLDPVEEGNQYGYVDGNVVNRVDPSGMIGERASQHAFCGDTVYSCEAFCGRMLRNFLFPGFGAGDLCLQKCYLEKAAALYPAFFEKIKQSTVSITIGCYANSDKPVCKNMNHSSKCKLGSVFPPCDGGQVSSLGTLNVDGITTHDHFFATYGSDMLGTKGFMTALELYDWIEFKGIKGTIVHISSPAKGLPVGFYVMSASLGTLKIQYPLLINLGNPVAVASKTDLRRFESLFFTYVPGENQITGHPNEDIKVGMALVTNRHQRRGEYETLVVGEPPSPGDSGGGWFNLEGYLVGTTYAVTSEGTTFFDTIN